MVCVFSRCSPIFRPPKKYASSNLLLQSSWSENESDHVMFSRYKLYNWNFPSDNPKHIFTVHGIGTAHQRSSEHCAKCSEQCAEYIYIYIFIYLFLFIYLYTYIHNLWLKKRRSRLKINQSLYPFAVCEARTPFALSSVIIIMRFTRRTTCR